MIFRACSASALRRQTFEVEDVGGGGRAKRPAGSPLHIIFRHDPLVTRRYPAASGDHEGIAVRLDVMHIA